MVTIYSNDPTVAGVVYKGRAEQDRINRVISGEKQHTTVFADCFDIFPMIPDHSVDMILADLPYGTTENEWDSVLNLAELWRCYKRIARPNAAIVLTGMQPFTSILVCSNLEWFKYEWIWHKTNVSGFLNAKKMPLGTHENILVFMNGGVWYNPIMVTGKKRVKGGKGKNATSYNSFIRLEYVSDQYYPKTIINIQSEVHNAHGDPYGKIHPNQKPVELFEYMIRTYTDEGMIVLDNTAGSFTTTIAAINTNRRSICIENNPTYYRLGTERIRKYIAERQKQNGAQEEDSQRACETTQPIPA